MLYTLCLSPYNLILSPLSLSFPQPILPLTFSHLSISFLSLFLSPLLLSSSLLLISYTLSPSSSQHFNTQQVCALHRLSLCNGVRCDGSVRYWWEMLLNFLSPPMSVVFFFVLCWTSESLLKGHQKPLFTRPGYSTRLCDFQTIFLFADSDIQVNDAVLFANRFSHTVERLGKYVFKQLLHSNLKHKSLLLPEASVSVV